LLSTPITGEGNRELGQLLNIPVANDDFFMEAHLKLRPLDFATEGIFLCGMAQYPKYIPETISQANGAAVRAATILSKGTILCSGAICEVRERECIGCGACQLVCPYGAVELQDTPEGLKVARVIPALCKGCGTCNAKCPTGAIYLNHFTDSQVFSKIAALGGG
jgi:heterodisulfide reductase subunit A